MFGNEFGNFGHKFSNRPVGEEIFRELTDRVGLSVYECSYAQGVHFRHTCAMSQRRLNENAKVPDQAEAPEEQHQQVGRHVVQKGWSRPPSIDTSPSAISDERYARPIRCCMIRGQASVDPSTPPAGIPNGP